MTGVDANQTGSGGGGNANNNTGGAAGAGAVGSTINFSVDTLPFGPSLDVIPYVSSDEYTVQMTIIPTLTEFLGYDTQTASQFQVQAQGSIGTPLQQQLPLLSVLEPPGCIVERIDHLIIESPEEGILIGE